MEKNGWIKIHRKILENPISNKPNYLALWIILLLKANHQNNDFIFNEEKMTCSAGKLLTGRKKLSQESGIKEGTVETILNYFESQHQIQQQKTNKFRLITVKNWNKYQQDEQQNQQQTDNKLTTNRQQTDNKLTTNRQQNDTNKNDKNDKNDKNVKNDKNGKKGGRGAEAPTPAEQVKIFLENKELQNNLAKQISEKKQIDINFVLEEIKKFISYWTEPTKSGLKQRWELQPVFEITRRLQTWFLNIEKYSKTNKVRKTTII